MPLFSKPYRVNHATASPGYDQTPVLPLPVGSLFWAWFSIGAQSFGGGSSTLFLIRRVIVEQRGWIRDDEVTKAWAICQLPPGINLLALTTLLGWRLGGVRGIGAALGGLLIPSVTITIVATAIYRSVQDMRVVQAALQGVMPATIGLGILMSWQLARPLLAASRAENWWSFGLSIALIGGSSLAVLITDLPIILVLVAGGLCGAFGYHGLNRSGEQVNHD